MRASGSIRMDAINSTAQNTDASRARDAPHSHSLQRPGEVASVPTLVRPVWRSAAKTQTQQARLSRLCPEGVIPEDVGCCSPRCAARPTKPTKTQDFTVEMRSSEDSAFVVHQDLVHLSNSLVQGTRSNNVRVRAKTHLVGGKNVLDCISEPDDHPPAFPRSLADPR